MRSWAELIVEAEEIGRILDEKRPSKEREVTKPPVPTSTPRPLTLKTRKTRKATKSVRKTNVKTSNTIQLEKEVSWAKNGVVPGPGRLRQFAVKADTSDYNISLTLDGETYLDDSWSDLNTVTKELDAVSAYQDGTDFVVSTSEVFFKNSLSTAVTPLDQATFSLLSLEVELLKT